MKGLWVLMTYQRVFCLEIAILVHKLFFRGTRKIGKTAIGFCYISFYDIIGMHGSNNAKVGSFLIVRSRYTEARKEKRCMTAL